MKAIQIISQDLFDKVRSRFTNLEMGDEQGAVTIDPAEARFFDFDLVIEGEELGRVSISINDPGSLKIYYSRGITEDRDDTVKTQWFNFLKEMRFFAMRRLLRFDTRDISKSNLEKQDFQHLATTQGSKEENMDTVNESRWVRNTKKTSRAVKGTTEVIVRHKQSMAEMNPALRSRPNKIESIFIQNSLGERFKYPFEHLDGAFAMAQHVDHEGVPHDKLGKKIIEMSAQIAQLQQFERHVKKSTLHDDAHGISEKAIAKMNELKVLVKNLGKRHHYESWAQEMSDMPDTIAEPLDPVTFEEYKAKFTQSSFNEALTDIFPLLANIMKEANKVDLEELVKEGFSSNLGMELNALTKEPDMHSAITDLLGDGSELGNYITDMYYDISSNNRLHPDDDSEMIVDKLVDYISADYGDPDQDPQEPAKLEFDQFEEWADNVVEGEQRPLEPEEIEDLKRELDRLSSAGTPLELGVDGETAFDTFKAFGLDSTELQDKLRDAANSDSVKDPLDVLADWAAENYPELLPPLGLTQSAQAQEPVSTDMQPEEPVAPEQPVAESKGNMIKDIAEVVKRYYNASNEEVGAFRSEEAVALEVEKTISEKYGEAKGKKAGLIAKAYMEKLTRAWEERHHKSREELSPPVDDDGLARVKELLAKSRNTLEMVKNKTAETDYSITGGPGGTPKLNPMGLAGGNFPKLGSSDPSTPKLDAMPKEEQSDDDSQKSHQYKTTMKHAERPTYQQRVAAHDIKPGVAGYRDRIDMLKDLERTGRLKKEDLAALEDIMKLSGLVK